MEKVWLRGVPGRGQEVLDMLKEFGGKACPLALSPYFAGNPRHIVFINHDGLIDFVHETNELAKVIKDCYKPIGLPAIQEPFWDDGTVLIRRDALLTFDNDFGSDFAIFDASERKVTSFMAYVELTFDNTIIEHTLLIFEDYRPATDEEIAEFVKRLRKIGKFWNPWTKKLEDL